jgi:hypothetical protein
MSVERNYYQLGSRRIRKSSIKRFVYGLIAVMIAVMFVSSLVYMILFGTSPQ